MTGIEMDVTTVTNPSNETAKSDRGAAAISRWYSENGLRSVALDDARSLTRHINAAIESAVAKERARCLKIVGDYACDSDGSVSTVLGLIAGGQTLMDAEAISQGESR